MRTFVSPMGDPTFANAAASLGAALFPNARTQAAARMAGAQYAGQLASNEQTGLENDGLRRSNTAFESLGDVIADPRIVAVLRAGGGNADQLSSALGNFQEQGFRQGARDKAVAGNYGGAVAEQFGLASGPVRINDIDSGYQLNPYQQGGPITATGETLADIAAAYAKAGASDAAANANNARAGYYSERTANPQRFMTPGSGDAKPLPAGDSRLLTSEILARIPKGVKYSEADLAAAIGTAENLRAQGLPVGTAAAQAFDQVFGLDAQPVEPTRVAGLFDGPYDWLSGAQVPTGDPARLQRRTGAPAPAAAPAPAVPAPQAQAPAAAPAAPKVQRIPASQYDEAIAAANRAIQNGADPDAVRQRLLDMGVPLQE